MSTDSLPTASFMETYDSDKNMSVPFMTIYEKTAIIGTRRTQIAQGVKSTLNDHEKQGLYTVNDIVQKEFELGKIPFFMCRKMPNQKSEYWKIRDFK
jgi:DNA-directed RNA polymerase subunit K/omega